MDLDNFKKLLNINGWAKFKIKDYEKFMVLQSHIIEGLKKNKIIKEEFDKLNINSVNELRQKSSSLSHNAVNLIRKEYIDDLSFHSINCFRDYIVPLFGNKLLSQKFPQIQINIPSNKVTEASDYKCQY